MQKEETKASLQVWSLLPVSRAAQVLRREGAGPEPLWLVRHLPSSWLQTRPWRFQRQHCVALCRETKETEEKQKFFTWKKIYSLLLIGSSSLLQQKEIKQSLQLKNKSKQQTNETNQSNKTPKSC